MGWTVCFGPLVSKLAKQLLEDDKQYIDDEVLGKIVLELVNTGQCAASSSTSRLSEELIPVLSILRNCISAVTASHRMDQLAEHPLKVLIRLVSIKMIALKSRPVSDLLVSRTDFCPLPMTDFNGREFVRISYLGPFFCLGVAANDDDNFCYEGSERFLEDLDLLKEEQKGGYYGGIQSKLGGHRNLLHKVVHTLLANSNSREKTLDFLSQMLKSNRKRTQIQADRSRLASNGVMMNFLSVMLDLSEKIQLEKVQNEYIFYPNCRVDLEDETRLAMSSDQVAEFVQTLDLSNCKPTFNTECFYMTCHALAVGFSSTVDHLKNSKRTLDDIQRQLKDAQEKISKRGPGYANHPNVIHHMRTLKNYQENFAKAVIRDECLLFDEFLLVRTVKFASKQLALVLRPIATDYLNVTLPLELPKTFGATPELYVESVIDFLTFLIKKELNIFLQNSADFAQQLLIMICSTHLIKNPFLSSKVVTVIFLLCPLYNPQARHFFSQILNHPISEENLFPSLTKFYADVESTGAHTEFYDKFNIRRSIQVIFKEMWQHGAHRNRLMQMARDCTQDFFRFTNMIINDMTFLLDESMTNLKTIHDIEWVEMNDTAAWAALSQETRQQKLDALSQAKSSVKTWLVLCNDTMELFISLTTDNPQYDFLSTSSGERVAAMLNHNIIQLCGPKCSVLKLRDAERRFGWNPKLLLGQVVDVYLNLSSEQFAENIAQDERSYNPDVFKSIVEKILGVGSASGRPILGMGQSERFKNLMEMAERHYNEKMQSEMDWGEDYPDEFKDALCYTMMAEPTRLPSGHVLDRKNILRHLLSDQTNPFTRQPLTVEELVPDLELKERIQQWIKESTAAREQNK
uniref:RING-type E3 ubiquitin transferase n=1 Tax=Ditylenchus dipsaci TaxID=166011 RepID=A0A915DTD8_9BILA